MRANRSRDTGPERAIRAALHRDGLRFRKDLRFLANGRLVRPDVVFTRARVAVFVDGCYWHRCPIHATDPKSNAEFWRAKFARNVARDRCDDQALRTAGWTVLRFWEHEDPKTVAIRIAEAAPLRFAISKAAKLSTVCRQAVTGSKAAPIGARVPASISTTAASI